MPSSTSTSDATTNAHASTTASATSTDPTPRGPLHWIHLGRIGYREALELQLRQSKARQEGRVPDTLFTLEHTPVITLGKRAKDSDVLLSEDALRARGIDLVHVDRGGEATWHGPGQLVLYPILHIKEQEIFVSDLVRGLAGCIRDFLQDHAIESRWDDDHPGIWVDDRKIAAVGMRIQRGVSRHGAAINLTTAKDAFRVIVPCGLPQFGVTSVAQESGEAIPIELAAEALSARFAAHFGYARVRMEDVQVPAAASVS